MAHPPEELKPRIFVASNVENGEDSFGASSWKVSPSVQRGDVVIFYDRDKGLSHAATAISSAYGQSHFPVDFDPERYYKFATPVPLENIRSIEPLTTWSVFATNPPFAKIQSTQGQALEAFQHHALVELIEKFDANFPMWLQEEASRPAPHGVWMVWVKSITDLPRTSGSISPPFDARAGVPRRSSKGDVLLVFDATPHAITHIATILETPKRGGEGNDGPSSTSIRIIEELENPLPLKAIKEHPTLKKWKLAQGDFFQSSQKQVEDLQVQSEIYGALLRLLIERNPGQSVQERLQTPPRTDNDESLNTAQQTTTTGKTVEGKATLTGEASLDVKATVTKPLTNEGGFYEAEQYWHGDRETCEDQLNQRYVASAIASFIRNPKTGLPLSIGIDAPWGMGKSSIMCMLRTDLDPLWNNSEKDPDPLSQGKLLQKLKEVWNQAKEAARVDRNKKLEEKKPSFVTVQFNAWRYGSGDKLTARMIKELLEQIANSGSVFNREEFWLAMNLNRVDASAIRLKVHSKMLFKTWQSLLILGGLVLEAGLTVFGELSVLFGAGSVVLTTGAMAGLLAWLKTKPVPVDLEQYLTVPDYNSLVGPVAGLEKDFETAANLLAHKRKTLVVFVDDLDRCTPDQIKSVVETINVFFNPQMKNCVFVLGMHSDLVAASLDLAYKDLVEKIENSPNLQDELPFGRRFLEKIVQFIVRLPVPQPEQIEDYLAHLAGTGTGHEVTEDEKADIRNASEDVVESLLDSSHEDVGLRHKAIMQHADIISKTQEVPIHAAARQIYQQYELGRAERAAHMYDESAREVRLVLGAVREFLGSNPRQYKRFSNALRFEFHREAFKRAALQRAPQPMEELLPLAKKVVLALEWPELSSVIERQDKFEKVLEAFTDGEAAIEFMFRDLYKISITDSLEGSVGERIRDLLADKELAALMTLELAEPSSAAS